MNLLRIHKALLKDRLQDTEFGILDKLLANDCLTHQETTAIQNCSTDPNVRNDRLIEEVLKKNIVPGFIKALGDTDQKHIANYLRGNGGQTISENFLNLCRRSSNKVSKISIFRTLKMRLVSGN